VCVDLGGRRIITKKTVPGIVVAPRRGRRIGGDLARAVQGAAALITAAG
jgi:hypothetical protein